MAKSTRHISLFLVLSAGVFLQAQGSTQGSISRYLARGDSYMRAYQFELAASAYKMALMHDPENVDAWARHRTAVERTRIIDQSTARAKALQQEGRYEEAADYLQRAVKLNPRSREIWQMYEQVLAMNPTAVYLQSEPDAWDAYREAKFRYEDGDYQSAERLLERINGFTEDSTLRYYVKSYLQKVQLKIKEHRPSERLLVADR